MADTLLFVLTIFLLGFAGSFVSGMVGIGGAIINYPLLLYVPAALGVAQFSSYDVSAITAVQVLFATIGGVWAYRKGGYLHKSLIAYMGVSILFGSFLGAYVSSLMSGGVIDIVYGVLALLAAIMMLVPKPQVDSDTYNGIFNRWVASVLAFLVGAGAGIVGAGGSFMLVPIMLMVLKVPTRITIASSLAITFISSVGSTAGKLLYGNILVTPAIIVIIASLLASPLGAAVGKSVNTKLLQWILAVLIVATAVKVWADILI